MKKIIEKTIRAILPTSSALFVLLSILYAFELEYFTIHPVRSFLSFAILAPLATMHLFVSIAEVEND
jgi:hypothetical protein